jgi:hypothetical protein
VAVEATQTISNADLGAKMKVVSSSSTALVKLKNAIEFSGGCLMNTSTRHDSCRCFTATPTEGYPEVVSL